MFSTLLPAEASLIFTAFHPPFRPLVSVFCAFGALWVRAMVRLRASYSLITYVPRLCHPLPVQSDGLLCPLPLCCLSDILCWVGFEVSLLCVFLKLCVNHGVTPQHPFSIVWLPSPVFWQDRVKEVDMDRRGGGWVGRAGLRAGEQSRAGGACEVNPEQLLVAEAPGEVGLVWSRSGREEASVCGSTLTFLPVDETPGGNALAEYRWVKVCVRRGMLEHHSREVVITATPVCTVPAAAVIRTLYRQAPCASLSS